MEIRSARPRDVDDIAHLLTECFIDDPVLAEYVRRSRDPELALRRYFTTELKKFYMPKGVVDVARDGGKLLGAALWAHPDQPMRRRDELRMLPGVVRALGRNYPRVRSFDAYDAAAEPGFRHWYFYTLVVSPSAQGQGIGGALLDRGIERAGGDPIYLESTTPDSRRLYERKGFIPLGEIPSPNPNKQTGMWHPGNLS
ncbi:GNAT family N-acetyltransferase [Arcanobacterium haemolyticum]|nr:GNAT family N-acetyltransferase [Arcanobacterium haemolyticum]